MAQKIVRIVGTLIGIILGALIFKDFGPFFVSAVGGAISISEPLGTSISSVLGGSFMGLIFYFLSPLTIKFYNRFMNWCDSRLKTLTQTLFLFRGVDCSLADGDAAQLLRKRFSMSDPT